MIGALLKKDEERWNCNIAEIIECQFTTNNLRPRLLFSEKTECEDDCSLHSRWIGQLKYWDVSIYGQVFWIVSNKVRNVQSCLRVGRFPVWRIERDWVCATHIYLKRAFNSLHYGSDWKIQRLEVVLTNITSLIASIINKHWKWSKVRWEYF